MPARAMCLPPMLACDENVCRTERKCGALVPFWTLSNMEVTMAGILMWLMGVPLIVIVLLYLIF
jgi:hypothetical protein